MTNEIRAALWGAIIDGSLTGVLTFIFTWGLQKFQEKRGLNNKKEYFTQAIIDDLQTSADLFEKVKDGWEKSKTIWFDYTIELKERRHIYQKNQELVLLYPGPPN